MSSESSSPTSTTRCLPIRRTPAIACPSIACSGGSKVFSALIPGAIDDSISAPRSASSSRRAVISTSGSSGMPSRLGSVGADPVELARAQQHDQLALADRRDPALLQVDAAPRDVVDDLDEVGVVADDEDPLLVAGREHQLARVAGVEALAQRLVEDGLAAKRLASQACRVERAQLGAGVDHVEPDVERPERLPRGTRLVLSARGQWA